MKMAHEFHVFLCLLLAGETGAVIFSWTNPPISVADGSAIMTISEDQTQGSTGITIQAVTDDVVAVAYTLSEQTEPGLFAIDSATGIINLQMSNVLDHETMPLLELVIVAEDIQPSYGTVTLTLSILNTAPTFEELLYTACFSEKNGAGSTIATIKASDRGGSPVTYSLSGGNFIDRFAITSAGDIQVAAGETLDTATDFYYLEIIAVDTGSSPLTGTTTLEMSYDPACSAAAPIGFRFLCLGVAFMFIAM